MVFSYENQQCYLEYTSILLKRFVRIVINLQVLIYNFGLLSKYVPRFNNHAGFSCFLSTGWTIIILTVRNLHCHRNMFWVTKECKMFSDLSDYYSRLPVRSSSPRNLCVCQFPASSILASVSSFLCFHTRKLTVYCYVPLLQNLLRCDFILLQSLIVGIATQNIQPMNGRMHPQIFFLLHTPSYFRALRFIRFPFAWNERYEQNVFGVIPVLRR